MMRLPPGGKRPNEHPLTAVNSDAGTPGHKGFEPACGNENAPHIERGEKPAFVARQLTSEPLSRLPQVPRGRNGERSGFTPI
jgi:hypothetical protein